MATNGIKRATRKSETTLAGLIDERTTAEKYLNMSTRSLQRLRQSRRIEFYRVGIRVYYTEEQIKSYLQRYCTSVARPRAAVAAAA